MSALPRGQRTGFVQRWRGTCHDVSFFVCEKRFVERDIENMKLKTIP